MPDDNQKFFRLNFKETLDRYVLKRSVMNSYRVLSLNDPFERSIVEQIKYNDPKGELIYICYYNKDELAPHFPTKEELVNVWHIEDWNNFYANYIKKKQEEQQARIANIQYRELKQKVFDAIWAKMPIDKVTVESMADGFIKTKDSPQTQALVKQLYGIDINELDAKIKE